VPFEDARAGAPAGEERPRARGPQARRRDEEPEAGAVHPEVAPHAVPAALERAVRPHRPRHHPRRRDGPADERGERPGQADDVLGTGPRATTSVVAPRPQHGEQQRPLVEDLLGDVERDLDGPFAVGTARVATRRRYHLVRPPRLCVGRARAPGYHPAPRAGESYDAVAALTETRLDDLTLVHRGKVRTCTRSGTRS